MAAPTLAEDLGLRLPRLIELQAEIQVDLEPEQLGIAWLRADMASKILLSDYLVAAAASLAVNLCEAAWSLRTVKDAHRRREKALLKHAQRAWDRQQGESAIDPPSLRREQTTL